MGGGGVYPSSHSHDIGHTVLRKPGTQFQEVFFGTWRKPAEIFLFFSGAPFLVAPEMLG